MFFILLRVIKFIHSFIYSCIFPPSQLLTIRNINKQFLEANYQLDGNLKKENLSSEKTSENKIVIEKDLSPAYVCNFPRFSLPQIYLGANLELN